MEQRKLINLEQVQEQVGLLDTDSGIVTQAVLNTDLEELLSPFVETVDYQLYFNYGNRILIGKYLRKMNLPSNNVYELNVSLIKKSIYHALKGNEYNLRTLIETINLDYDPINNYEVHETTVTSNDGKDTMTYGATSQTTTSSISSFGVETVDQWGEDVNTKDVSLGEKSYIETTNHGTIEKTIAHDTTQTIGAQENTKMDDVTYGKTTETHSTDTTLGATTENRTLTQNKGERGTNAGEDIKVSAYNATDYKPSSQTTTNQTQNAVTDTDTENTTNSEHTNTESGTITKEGHTDNHSITESLGERADKTTGSDTETINGYIDTINFKQNPYEDTDTYTRKQHTDTHNRTENPHSKTSQTDGKEHTDTKDSNNTENRQRDLKGRYGFTTIQSMIEAERNLANLNISERIISIVIHQICEGVLYLW